MTYSVIRCVHVFKWFPLSAVMAWAPLASMVGGALLCWVLWSLYWSVLSTRRSRTLDRFRHWTNFRCWLVVGQRREKTGPDKLIVPLIVQMTFEFESTHLHIQSFRPQFYLNPSSKEVDSCFLMMTLQIWVFPYQVTLHLVSTQSFRGPNVSKNLRHYHLLYCKKGFTGMSSQHKTSQELKWNSPWAPPFGSRALDLAPDLAPGDYPSLLCFQFSPVATFMI